MTRRAVRVLGALVVVVIVAAVAIGIAVRARVSPPPAPVSAAVVQPSVALATVAVGSFVERVHAPGRVGSPAGNESRLAFVESGIVAAIDVHVGEAVVAGQALAELDAGPRGLDAARARADAGLRLAAAESRLAAFGTGSAVPQGDAASAAAAFAQSRAKVASDRSALAREQQLYDAGIAAAKDVEAARAQLALDRADAAANAVRARITRAAIDAAQLQARADVAQMQSDVRTADRTLVNATLRAPVDGVVTAILKHTGEGTDATQPAIVVETADANSVTLTVGPQVAGVRAGDPVTMTIPGRDARGRGVVRSVIPATDPLTQTTVVVVAGAPAGARPGDAVDATILLASRSRRGIVIPTAAIVTDPEAGTTLVFVREGARFSARPIVVAAGDERTSLVSAGLRPGERIAVQGAYDLLAPGGS